MSDREGLEKLAPCPFCGDIEPTLTYSGDGMGGAVVFVCCHTCDAQSDSAEAGSVERCVATYESMAKVTGYWNRRALLAAGTEDGDTNVNPDAQPISLAEQNAGTEGVGLREALKGLVEAVGAMKVPKTIADAALQIEVTLGPAFLAAKAALTTRPVGTHTPGLESAAWDMLHAVEAADAAGELADNIGGEVIDALRAELTPPRISEGRRALSACAPMESKSYTCTHCEKAFPRSSQGWADCMNHQQNCKGERNEAV